MSVIAGTRIVFANSPRGRFREATAERVVPLSPGLNGPIALARADSVDAIHVFEDQASMVEWIGEQSVVACAVGYLAQERLEAPDDQQLQLAIGDLDADIERLLAAPAPADGAGDTARERADLSLPAGGLQDGLVLQPRHGADGAALPARALPPTGDAGDRGDPDRIPSPGSDLPMKGTS